MVSLNPLKVSSVWQCDACGLKMDNVKITKIQEIAGRLILNNAVKKDAPYIVEYLNDHVSKFLLPSNQFTVELKLQAIRKIQDESSLELLVEKEKYCLDILEILAKLSYGECFVKGVLCYELFKARMVVAARQERVSLDEVAKNSQFLNAFFYFSRFRTRIRSVTCEVPGSFWVAVEIGLGTWINSLKATVVKFDNRQFQNDAISRRRKRRKNLRKLRRTIKRLCFRCP